MQLPAAQLGCCQSLILLLKALQLPGPSPRLLKPVLNHAAELAVLTLCLQGQ
jgi:hypothetical protein